MDGEMLAAFLADHNVAIVNRDGLRQFSRDAFLDWLRESSNNAPA